MRVLIDVDGVLAQWKVQFKKYLEEVGFFKDGIGWESKELPLTEWQLWQAWARMCEPDVAFNLKPFPGAIEGVECITDDPDNDVYFVTAQVDKSPTWVFDRTRWLIKYFGEEQGKKVVFTHHKHLCHGDVLVDDKEYNVKAWLKEWPQKIGVLWTHPQNWGQDTVGVRLSSWGSLLKTMEEQGITKE